MLSRRIFLGLPVVLWPVGCGSQARSPVGGGGADAGSSLGGDGGNTSTGDGGVAGPFASGPEPSAMWAPAGNEDAAAFPSGVQTGDATPSGVVVSARTAETTVDARLVRGTARGWEPAGEQVGLPTTSGVVALELVGLAPDTTYALAVFARDGTRRSRPVRFRTALPSGQKRLLRFGATSCLGLAGAPFASMTKCAEAGPLDFFCLLGDTIYADGQADLEGVWRTALAQTGLVDITAATSVVAIWDDHEIDNNWSWTTPGIQARHDEALAAFNRAMPHRQGPAGSKLFRKLSWGDAADVFVLDCRDERRNGDYISELQMDWLKAELSKSKARFKLLLNSVPIIDFAGTPIGNVQASDRWQGYPQRAEILEHIAVQKIGGVLWLSGDFHFGLVSHVGQPGALAADQWEVLCGPAGSDINVVAHGLSTGPQITDIVKELNSLLFEADPDAGTVKVRFVGNAGQTLAARVLSL